MACRAVTICRAVRRLCTTETQRTVTGEGFSTRGGLGAVFIGVYIACLTFLLQRHDSSKSRSVLEARNWMSVLLCTGEPEAPQDMGTRTRVRLKVLALLPICILGALADDQDRSLKISSSGHGPETRIVSNATELGRALQDHMITNIIIRGEHDA